MTRDSQPLSKSLARVRRWNRTSRRKCAHPAPKRVRSRGCRWFGCNDDCRASKPSTSLPTLSHFTGPGGLVRTVEVKDPNAQKFISKLKKGDHVELTYSEALAVSVEPAAR